ncbi:MAG: hypothetical protein K2J70_05945 [Muribaculaceae bacterium]|nr:hypothetical protein [Muribaculaceae bacterium]
MKKLLLSPADVIRRAITPLTAMLLIAGVSSCSDDPENPSEDSDLPSQTQPDFVSGQGVFLLNQGQFYNGIEGSLNFFDFSDLKVSNNIFAEINKRSLGDTPQCGVAYGGKIYIGVYNSNTIEILSASDYKSIKQILLDGTHGKEPRAIVPEGDKLYITMYDGYVARLDTTTLSIDKSVKVGPNPETPVIHKGKLFVPNSDGMNWANGYGTTASIVDLATFNVEATVDVPLNPDTFLSSGNRLFLLSKGNYGDVESALYEIDPEIASIQTTSDKKGWIKIANATIVGADNEKVYLINAPFREDGIVIDYSIYNTLSSVIEEWKPEGVDYPNAMAADPFTGNVVISSYIMDGPFPSYTAPGYGVLYGKDLKQKAKFNIGTGPAAIFFTPRSSNID